MVADRASTAAERASVAAKTAAATATTASANAKSTRAACHAVEAALARVKAIQAYIIKNAHAKILQASPESSIHRTSKEAAAADAEMNADDAAAEAMEPFPHEISERELEMWEPSESANCWEELRVAQEEVEKRLSIEELAVEYQREL